MGLYIKGMEMPDGCFYCPCNYDGWCAAVPIDDNGIDRKRWEDERMDFCPLVPVPPHGRLIDADALDDILADQSEDAYNRTHAPKSWERALSAMRDYIGNAPTIIPAEEGKT